VKRRSVWGTALALMLVRCLDHFELPATSGTAAGGPDAGGTPLCGGDGQTCCADTVVACDVGLRCDVAAGVCVTEELRLCTSEAECRAGQTCCPSGLLGSCLTLTPGAACPRPDLQIVTSPEDLHLNRKERWFDPDVSSADACALEKGCLGGRGLRQLLQFSIEIANVGDADLILGIPGATSAFQTAACDGASYFPNYLRYQLLDINGVAVPGAEGRAQARCQQLPDGFSSRFSCDFWGLWRDYSEVFLPEVEPDPVGADCQWIDVTDVAPGEYVLRVTADPDGVLADPSSGNQKDYPVRLPELANPTQNCPSNVSDSGDVTGGDSLLGAGIERECGWSTPAGVGMSTCTPGESITVDCAGCDVSQGDAMLRVCDGAGPCSALSALANGNDTFSVFNFDDSTPPSPEQLSDIDCNRRVRDDENLVCEFVSTCPVVAFACPASGTYSVLQASFLPNAAAICDATTTP